ncbi:MAG TPA: UDP-N-acetylglucosamine 1-carboxyvinyltransferase [Ignavibacteria bacterium]|nr:UDP-N-acetylglucosamine 1-carboxyvinyltransferase [Ignavibacteria bacterium]HRF66645.1 UDP-N-acetylglucosamine 1-carboxyvinyltransferase [Ignavibacteria bacterium]
MNTDIVDKQAKFLVKGAKPLHGSIRISGAKNAASKLIIASLLTDEPVRLINVPVSISEIKVTRRIIESLGAKFSKFTNDELIVQTKKIHDISFSASLGLINRIGVLTAGPLLLRSGEAKIPKPGGDQIGARPINFHLDALIKLGATVKEHKDFYLLKAKKLIGTDITLPFPSVGATENIIITASLAIGKTTIHNAAIEPEIMDLIMLLQKMGAIIDVKTDRTIVITGVDKLCSAEHRVIPDRLEAASFACAAIASKGDVTIHDARHADMITFLNTIRLIGAEYEVLKDGIRFYYKGDLKPISIETDVHPGFMTDWQPPMTILLTQANGISTLHETVYENRFGYIKELNKMGAAIELTNDCLGTPCRFNGTNYYHSAVIKGKTPLHSAEINVPDIRAGFSYLVAAILAKGETLVHGIHYIDRGYENIDKKLRKLGVKIRRV